MRPERRNASRPGPERAHRIPAPRRLLAALLLAVTLVSAGMAPVPVRAQTGPDLATVPAGATAAAVRQAWGEPLYQTPGLYNLEWWVYNPAPARLLNAGFRNGRLAAVYGQGAGWSYKGVTIDHTPGQAAAQLGVTYKGSVDWQQATYQFDCSSRGRSRTTELPLVEEGRVALLYVDRIDNRVSGAMVFDAGEFMVSGAVSRLPFCSWSSTAAFPGGAAPAGPAMAAAEQGEARLQLEMANTARALRGIAPLGWHDGVAGVARAHSRDMDENRFFSHTSPTTGTPEDRMKRAGLLAGCARRSSAENIGMGSADSAGHFHAWMNSPGHRSGLLNPQWQDLGVGISGAFATQNFRACTP